MQDVTEGGLRTLVLSGELDIAHAADVETRLLELSTDGITGIALDLRRLTFMGSAGLRLAFLAQKVCAYHGYDFFLIPGSDSVQRVFELAGLSDALPFRTALSGDDALELA